MMLSTILITCESSNRERKFDDLEQLMKKLGDDDCRVLNATWCIKTAMPLPDIHKMVIGGLQPTDRCLIVPIAGPWLDYNARTSYDDCQKR